MIFEDFPDLSELVTDRLCLRKVRPGDAEDYFAFARDPLVARYVTFEPHKRVEQSRARIASLLMSYKTRQVAPWGIVLRENGHLIGTCGFCEWEPRRAWAEIAYLIGRPYWGHGYMPEAVRAVIDYGFVTLALKRIAARCLVENTASARVMEKAGMHFEGMERQYLYADGQYRDLKAYAIDRDDWEAARTT